MRQYELTLEAESDLREIGRYTQRQWGKQQMARYARLLEQTFQAIAEDRAAARIFSENYPQVRVIQCERHFIFYLRREGQKPCILAVLHERMDMLARLMGRLTASTE